MNDTNDNWLPEGFLSTSQAETSAEPAFDLEAGITYEELLAKGRETAVPVAIVLGELVELPDNAKPEHKFLADFVKLKKQYEQALLKDFPQPNPEQFGLTHTTIKQFEADKKAFRQYCEKLELDADEKEQSIKAWTKADDEMAKRRSAENAELTAFRQAFKKHIAYNTSLFDFTFIEDLSAFVKTKQRNSLQKTINISNLKVLLELAGLSEKTVADYRLAVLQQETQIHTMTHYARTLPAWDGVSRIEHLCTKVLSLDSTYELYDLQKEMLKRWLKATVTRWLEPGYKNDLCLVLISDQGQRKDTFFSRLVPTDSLFSTQSSLTEKDDIMEAHGGGIVILTEIGAIYRKADQETFKAHVQKQYDKIRPPYEKTVLHLPRVYSFSGTSNDTDILIDATGNRRILCLALPYGFEIDVDWVDEHRDQLWAEAIASDWKSWFSEAELQRINQLHTRENDDLIAVMTLLAHDSIADLQNCLGLKGQQMVLDNDTSRTIVRDKIGERQPVLLTSKNLWFCVASLKGELEKRGPFTNQHGGEVKKWMLALGFKQTAKRLNGRLYRTWMLANLDKFSQMMKPS